MAAAPTYADYVRDELAPPWLKRTDLDAGWLAAHGEVLDDLVARVRAAVKLRFVLDCVADALPYHGAARGLERYVGDTDASYRARLARAWELWQLAGTAAGIVAILNAAGFSHVAVYEALGAAAPGEAVWPPDGDAANWSRFWVLIDASVGAYTPFAWKSVTWGSGGAGNRTWGSGWTWGSNATREQVATLRRIVRTWKPAHMVCAEILVDLPSGSRIRWPGQV
jgi:hypothetical protein